MSLIINGSKPTKIIHNNINLSKVICNGVTVWTSEIIDHSFNFYWTDWKGTSNLNRVVPTGTYIMFSTGNVTSSYFNKDQIILKTFSAPTAITASLGYGGMICIIKANISAVSASGYGSWYYYKICNTHGDNTANSSITLPAGNWICLGIPGGNNQGSAFVVGNTNVQENPVFFQLSGPTVFTGNYRCAGGDGGKPTDNIFYMIAAHVII